MRNAVRYKTPQETQAGAASKTFGHGLSFFTCANDFLGSMSKWDGVRATLMQMLLEVGDGSTFLKPELAGPSDRFKEHLFSSRSSFKALEYIAHTPRA